MNRLFSIVMIISTIINVGLIYQLRNDIVRLESIDKRLTQLTEDCAQFENDTLVSNDFLLRTQRLLVKDLHRLDCNQRRLISMVLKEVQE